MFFRTKVFTNEDGSTRTYLQFVTGERVEAKVRQKAVANLGRLEDLQARAIDQTVTSLAKFSTR